MQKPEILADAAHAIPQWIRDLVDGAEETLLTRPMPDIGRAEESGELKQVEDSYRLALELFYLPDLSYKEIAATLGLPSAVM
jgi:DNA-directed RNA polymerase specialized sigma24 family protein